MKTKEEIIEAINKFYYINLDTWKPIVERTIEIEKEPKEEIRIRMMAGLIWEEVEILKLGTVERYLKKTNEQQRQFFKSFVTNPKTHADELGIIENVGVKMTPEEFEIYLTVYDEMYELIADNSVISKSPRKTKTKIK